MYKKTDALGVFDSGVGGLTVVEALRKLMPNEQIYYLADTLNLPYGNKQKDDLEQICIQNGHFLLNYPIKALIVACNTASALAYETLKKRFNLPIFDVISPVVSEAILTSRNQKIAVLATESTIHSNVYEQLIKSKNKEASVLSIACPLFVPVVEENLLSHRITAQLIKQYLAPLVDSDVDTLILGCTHYPLLKEMIQRELGPQVSILDSAQLCAKQVYHFLKENKLLSTQKKTHSPQFFVSDKPKQFEIKGSELFGQKISEVKKVNPSQ